MLACQICGDILRFVFVCEVCGKKMSRIRIGDMLWWNEKVKETISRKKDAHRAICSNSAEENMNWYIKACRIKQG